MSTHTPGPDTRECSCGDGVVHPAGIPGCIQDDPWKRGGFVMRVKKATDSSMVHTPGPWTVYKFTRDELRGFVVMADGEENLEIAEIYPKPTPVAVNHANARLIAAAPELLEALQFIADPFSHVLTNPETVIADLRNVARAAIVKARRIHAR